jgi:hypothetical protein
LQSILEAGHTLSDMACSARSRGERSFSIISLIVENRGSGLGLFPLGEGWVMSGWIEAVHLDCLSEIGWAHVEYSVGSASADRVRRSEPLGMCVRRWFKAVGPNPSAFSS